MASATFQVAPLDAPLMKEFVDFLDPVNRFADESPGFVWRMQGKGGQASSYLPSPFADPLMITNLTVWADLDALRGFTYQTVHRYFLQSRRKWFDRVDGHQLVLWWIPAGEIPTLAEAKRRLELLEGYGPSAEAFTLQAAFDAAGGPLPCVARTPGEGVAGGGPGEEGR